MTEARPSDYWFSGTALYIQLNAVGDYNFIHANCTSGSMVMCHVRGVDGLGYDNAHNYRRWKLKASPTAFHDDEKKYVYIAIPKSSDANAEAQVVFPGQQIDLYGYDENGNQVAPDSHFYIFTQGIISASRESGVQKPRTWIQQFDSGTLASDEAIANGGDGAWWRWNHDSDTITFLKEIMEAVIRKLSVDYASISQLELGKHLLNGVANDSTNPEATDKVVTPAYAVRQYLSKVIDDVAAGHITFQQGLRSVLGAALEGGATFGDFVSGDFFGKGAAVDAAGNAEVESIVVRSYMKVMELIYNRLNALEGDTTFADSGTIEQVIVNDDGSVEVELRKRWDGDFTAFQPGDIVYGYVNNLDKAGAKEYYKAWAWIKSVDRVNNRLTVVAYPDAEVPSGVNHPLAEGMVIARWGNNIEANEDSYSNPDYTAVIGRRGDGSYYNKRQRLFYISCEDGNLVELMGVNKPILERGNYGTVLGAIPDGLLDEKTAELVNKDQPYLYARGIIVQDLIRIGYEGVRTRTPNYRGWWDAGMAASDTAYYRSTTDMYDEVTYDGALWQCVVAHADAEPPSELSASWVKMTDAASDWRLNFWNIYPNVTVISVRSDAVVPERVTCEVVLNSNAGARTFTSNIDLYDAGARLYYSVDGKQWQEFSIGEVEPLELEDGTGNIELEGDMEDLVLTIGGDDVDAATVGDRIYFELRSVEDSTVLAMTQVPVVKDGARGAFKSTAFIRTNGQPDTPTGGTYDSPLPTSWHVCGDGTVLSWSDGIPAGEEMLWASTRVFRDNMATEWTQPRQMTDTATYDVEFSDIDESPGDPTSNPGNWYDPDIDKDAVDFTRMLWRAERQKKNGEWSDWTIVRIKGEKGESGEWTSYAFKKSGERPDTPTDTEHTIPDGWEDAPDGDGRWWMSMATIDAVTHRPGKWSVPVQVTAEDGVSGGYVDFKYRAYAEGEIPLSIVRDTRHPEGWDDVPPPIDPGYALWMIQADIDCNNNLVGVWSDPVRISGEKGADGGEIFMWTINPNTNIISVRRDKVEPEVVTATVMLNASTGAPVEYTSSIDLYEMGCELMYSLDGLNWERFVIGDYEPLELEDGSGSIEMEASEDGSLVLTLGGDDISTSRIGDRVYFELRSVDDGAALASAQVPVVKDGEDGAQGRNGLMCYPAGVFDPERVYISTGETTPVVMYGDTYFRLEHDHQYCGSTAPEGHKNPAEDCRISDELTVWVKFDMFDSVFADIIMAKFGKIGSAVFYGDWMISQQGVRQGKTSEEYQYFKSDKEDEQFKPNYSVNFKTGEVRAVDGVFAGTLKADILNLGVARMPDDNPKDNIKMLTQALNVTTGGYFALPALAAGTSRVIEILVMGTANKASQELTLYGNSETSRGNLVKITTQCDLTEASHWLRFVPVINENAGIRHYVQGTYRCIGWRLSESDALNAGLDEEDKTTTYWNVVRLDDATEAALRVMGGTHYHPNDFTPPSVLQWSDHIEDDDYKPNDNNLTV